MSVSGWTNTTSGYDNNDYGTTLTNGVYNNGTRLTSVGSLSGLETYGSLVDVYGIDDADLSQWNNGANNTVCYPYVSLFGSKVNSSGASNEQYSKDNVNKSYILILKIVFPN